MKKIWTDGENVYAATSLAKAKKMHKGTAKLTEVKPNQQIAVLYRDSLPDWAENEPDAHTWKVTEYKGSEVFGVRAAASVWARYADGCFNLHQDMELWE